VGFHLTSPLLQRPHLHGEPRRSELSAIHAGQLSSAPSRENAWSQPGPSFHDAGAANAKTCSNPTQGEYGHFCPTPRKGTFHGGSSEERN
jgi:hypothetical protein